MSQIYFIEVEGFVKIGVSKNVIKRFRQISGASPFEPKLLGVMDGGHAKEAELHERFSRDRIRNEWFRLGGEIREFVQENCNIIIVPKPFIEPQRETPEPNWKSVLPSSPNDPYYCLQFYVRDSAREKMRAQIDARLRRIAELELNQEAIK